MLGFLYSVQVIITYAKRPKVFKSRRSPQGMAVAFYKDCNAGLDPLGPSLWASRDRASGECLQPEVLRHWARAKAIPGEALLALDRLPTRCSRHCYLDSVLVHVEKKHNNGEEYKIEPTDYFHLDGNPSAHLPAYE